MIYQIAPILFLFGVALALLVIHLYKPAFAYYWMVTVIGTIFLWGYLLVTRAQWVLKNVEIKYIAKTSFSANLAFNFDPLAWIFFFTVLTVLLSNLLTSVGIVTEQNSRKPDWKTYATFLSLSAFCALVCCAGNLISFQILWIFVDVLELVIWSARSLSQPESRNLAVLFGLKVASQLILFGATAISISDGSSTVFSTIPVRILPYILIACGLRLGVLPPYPSAVRQIATTPIQKPVLFLLSTAPAAVLLARIAEIETTLPATHLLVLMAALASLSAGLSWLSKSDISSNPALWVQGAGALVVVSSASGLADATLGWGLALLLLGGLVLEYHISWYIFRPAIWLGAISLISLPFTMTWAGTQVFSPPGSLQILLIFGQSLLVVCFFRYSFHRTKNITYSERWILPLYGIGLLVLVSTSIYLGRTVFPQGKFFFSDLLGSIDLLLPGLIIAAVSSMLILFIWVSPRKIISSSSFLARLLDFSWLYQILAFPISLANRFLRLVSNLLEGQAGIFWAILIMVLLITILQQSGLGG
jgi:hypothetical protein